MRLLFRVLGKSTVYQLEQSALSAGLDEHSGRQPSVTTISGMSDESRALADLDSAAVAKQSSKR